MTSQTLPFDMLSAGRRCRRRAPAAAAALLAALCGAATALAAESDATPIQELPPFAEAAIERHIEYLARDALEGREAGALGCEIAERYIRDVWLAAGLDAVEEQPFDLVAGARLEPGSALAIGGEDIAAEDFTPLGFSAAGGGSFPAAFAGYGIRAPDLEHDDYSAGGIDLDVRGRAVVVISGSPDGANPHGPFAEHAALRARALAAASRGARALLVIQSGGEDEPLPAFDGDANSRDVGIPVVIAREAAVAARLGIEPAKARVELDAHRAVSRLLNVEVRIDARVRVERRVTRNMLGWLSARGPDVVPEIIVVGAHHDHLGRGIVGAMRRDRIGEIHNGADDNASGVAGVLELARALAPRRDRLRRHLLFMTFGAEEWGLLGSKHFKDHPVLRLPGDASGGASGDASGEPLSIVAMINMDMIGRLREDRLLISGAATSPVWPELLELARDAGGHTLRLEIDTDKELLGSSDHISFYQLGAPVVFFFTGNHPQYHSPDDDLWGAVEGGEVRRLIEIAGQARILRYIADVIAGLDRRPERLPLQEGIDLMPRMSFRVVLRLLPDYGADVDGMRVAGITAGGPAAIAGLAEGDVIVRFGDTPVRSVRDYMVGLGKAEPGKELEVEILRGDARRVLRVTPLGFKGAP